MNAAALASLALGPKAPQTLRESKTGEYKGRMIPNLARGRSRYAAVLKWTNENPEPDLAGFANVSRSTLAPCWENEPFVGNVHEYTFENRSVDDIVFGVKAIDKDGDESLVAPYPDPMRRD